MSDNKQRETALEPTHSFIVQAPAGSGKTTLLVQRYLTLLATVKNPEEIIAITFTRKAAAEMQNRVLDALELTEQHTAQHTDQQHTSQTNQVKVNQAIKTGKVNSKTILLAQAALQKDRLEKWHLLQNPHKLRIQTIDSLCGYLTSRTPISSGIGGKNKIVQNEEAEKYYRLAAENLLHDAINDTLPNNSSLPNDTSFEGSATTNLLLHLDNDREYFIERCIDMLKKREQWLPHIMGVKNQYNLEQLRHILEQGLQNSIREILEQCHRHFPQTLLFEISALLNFATSNLKKTGLDIKSHFNRTHEIDYAGANVDATLADTHINEEVDIWLELNTLLLTKEGEWRKIINKQNGFPSKETAKNKEEKTLFAEMKNRMLEVLAQLKSHEHEPFRQSLLELENAPSATYSDTQWQVLCSLLEILPLLTAQLKLIFQTKGATDHAEISMAADHALGRSDAPSELALNLDYRIKHLLVDEFQDTSLAQYRLLEKLTAGWEENDERTLFLVGDPMQSIYRFRQAEVGLFLRAQNNGIGNITLRSLRLTTNFRSHPNLISWFNESFARIFPSHENMATGSIPFTACEAATTDKGADKTDTAIEKKTIEESEITAATTAAKQRVTVKVLVNGDAEHEANYVVAKIKTLLHEHEDDDNDSSISSTDLKTKTNAKLSIAILLQTRTNAKILINALKAANLPYQATELESLTSSAVIKDLFALTRALCNLGDKIAWLSILRAPWCGLSLHDLYAVANHHFPTIWQNICDYQNLSQSSTQDSAQYPTQSSTECYAQNITQNSTQNRTPTLQLSPDGITRIKRLLNALTPALKHRAPLNLCAWIEEAWLRLGGPACYKDPSTLEDADIYLTLLENRSIDDLDLDAIKEQLENLYLSTNDENAQIQIMTIHKAKGLEFDHVIVTNLNRTGQSDKEQLLLWLEQPRQSGDGDLLLAPIKETLAKENKTYHHLKKIEQNKNQHETTRLLYVAATRAKQSLHLVASINQQEDNKLDNEFNEHREDTEYGNSDKNSKDDDGSSCNGDRNTVQSPATNSLLKHLWPCFNEDWLDNIYNKNSEKSPIIAEKNTLVLSRLASDWQHPCTSDLELDLKLEEMEIESSRNLNGRSNTNLHNPSNKFTFNLPDDHAARLGTVIHLCLQKLACDIKQNHQDFNNINTIEQYISSQQIVWKKILMRAGLYHDLTTHLKKIACALRNMQSDQVGKWIMSYEHHEIRNEYAITLAKSDSKQTEETESTATVTKTTSTKATAENESQHLIIDRTFIDENNIRWIIDYKTSAPRGNNGSNGTGIELEEFLNHEKEKYQSQLEQYALALSNIEKKQIYLGLYFPLCKGWIKWQY